MRATGNTGVLKTVTVALMALPILFSGCRKANRTEPGGGLKVTVTTGIIADAVSHIGGGRLQVTALMGPGVDPHLFKASEGDVARLADADIIIYNGLHLEGKMGEVLGKLARRKPVIPAGELLPADRLRSPPAFKGHYDPHIWFDLDLWATMVEALGDSLGRLDTAYTAVYNDNAKRYAAEIRELHRWVGDEIATIPSERRVLITAHDAFGYFGRAYDIEVRGLQGISTVSEYGLKDVTDLVDFIVGRGIKAVFVESSVSPKSIEAVKAGVQARGNRVAVGGTLYSDALGEGGTPEDTYLGMVEYNVRTIVAALH